MPSRKITFKTEKSSGKWRSFYPDYHQIKFMGEAIGSIDDEHPHKIRLMVIKDNVMEDGNPNCEWKWIQLSNNFESVALAKEFIRQNNDLILKKYNFPIKNKDNAQS